MAFKWFWNLAIRAKDLASPTINKAGDSVEGLSKKTDKSKKNLVQFARGARAAAADLHAMARAFDLTQLATTRSFQLQKAAKELTAQMGLGLEATERFADGVVGLSNVTGLATEVTGQLGQALAVTGRSFEDLDPALRGYQDNLSGISDGAAQNSQMLAELVGRYGVSAASAVEASAGAATLGLSIGNLVNQTAEWQEQFRMPGMLQQLPASVQFARRSIAQFGRSVTGSASSVIATTLRLGATFSKTFGVDMARSVQMAQANFEHFAQQSRQDQDVFLGLSDSFSGMSMALMEAVPDFGRVQKLMKQGQDDPIAFAKSIQQIRGEWQKVSPQMAERFYRNVIMNSSDAVKHLLTEKGAIEAAEAARAEANRIQEEQNAISAAGAGAFDRMTGSLKDTAVTAIETFKNLLSLGKTIIGLAFADDVNKMFKGLNGTLADFNVKIKEMTIKLRESEWFKKMQPWIHGAGKALIVAGTAISAVAGAFGAVIFPAKTTVGIFKRIPIVGGATTKIFSLLGRAIVQVGKKVLLPVMAIKSLAVAFADMGKAFKDPNLSGAQRFTAVIKGLFVGIADFVDGLFFGLPSMILGKFFPSMQDGFATGIGRMFDQFMRRFKGKQGSVIGNVMRSLKDLLLRGLIAVRGFVMDNLDGWVEGLKEFGANLGRGLAGFAVLIKDMVVSLLSRENWIWAWNSITEFFSGEGTSQFTTVLSDLGNAGLELVSALFGSIADEILMSFGSSLEEVSVYFHGWWTDFANMFDVLATNFGDPLILAWKKVSLKISEVSFFMKSQIATLWLAISQEIGSAVGWIIENVIGPFVAKIAEAALEIQEWKATFGLIEREDLVAARKHYGGLANFARGYAKELAQSAKERVASSEIELAADKKALEEKRANLDKFEDEVKKRDKTRASDLRKRQRERNLEQKKLEEAAAQVGKAKRDQRAKEQKEFGEVNQAREAAISNIEGIIKAAEEKRKAAEESGSAGGAKMAASVIKAQTQLLDQLGKAESKERIAKILAAAGDVAKMGKIETPGPKPVTAAAPAAVAARAAPMAAPAAAGATGPAGGAAVSGRVGVDVQIKGDADKVFEAMQNKNDTRFVGIGGGG